MGSISARWNNGRISKTYHISGVPDSVCVGTGNNWRLVVGIAPADNPHSNGQGGKVKPNPIKAFLRLSDLFNILFSQAQEIKRLRAENAKLSKTLRTLDRELSGLRGAIKQAWSNGVISEDVVK